MLMRHAKNRMPAVAMTAISVVEISSLRFTKNFTPHKLDIALISKIQGQLAMVHKTKYPFKYIYRYIIVVVVK